MIAQRAKLSFATPVLPTLISETREDAQYRMKDFKKFFSTLAPLGLYAFPSPLVFYLQHHFQFAASADFFSSLQKNWCIAR